MTPILGATCSESREESHVAPVAFGGEIDAWFADASRGSDVAASAADAGSSRAPTGPPRFRRSAISYSDVTGGGWPCVGSPRFADVVALDARSKDHARECALWSSWA